MSERYVVILDNNLVEEPLAPGLPYWAFGVPRLPTRETAAAFVEDVLFQSELWANEGSAGGWVSLRLLACRSMCARCGRLLVTTVGNNEMPFHVVWYIAENEYSDVFGEEGFVSTGLWYAQYGAHRCVEDFFDGNW
ncbi:MAG: hypothetical protein ACOCXI_09745 [Chloroflexota bacterium]